MSVTPRKYEYNYLIIVPFAYGHFISIYSIYLCFTKAMWLTIFFHTIIYLAAQIGVTAGAHRLWSHRAYKANIPLQVILLFFFSFSNQYSVINWVKDHRVHHKYSDTDADPHNSRRGFFFSHVGWLLVKKHPEVKIKGKEIDFSDVLKNSLLVFQKKHIILLSVIFCPVIPTAVPMYYWGESLNCAWHLGVLRMICNLNATFLINSAAHMWGYKPYDKSLLPAQNLTVSILSAGEGFHNYHHTFPLDYRAAELGNNGFNLATLFIDLFAKIGWAYDLKTTSKEIIAARQTRTGDGTDLWGNPLDEIKENSKILI